MTVSSDSDSRSGEALRVPRRRLSRLAILAIVLLGLAIWNNARLRAFYHLSKSQALLRQTQLDAALIHAERAAAARPNDFDVLLNLLIVQRQTDRIPEARLTLASLEADEQAPAEVRYQRVLLDARTGNLAAAESQLQNLLTNNIIDSRDVCDSFVVGFRMQSRFDEAQLLLNAWQKDWPHDYRPHAHLGVMLQMSTQWNPAIKSFDQAIQLGDPRSSTHVRRGQCLREINDDAKALAAFQRAVELDSSSFEAWKGLAECSRTLGYGQQSEAAWLECLALEPFSFDARLAIAENAYDENDLSKANEILEQLLTDWPSDLRALFLYGKVLAAAGRVDEANAISVRWQQSNEKVLRMEELMRQLQLDPTNNVIRSEAAILMMQYFSRSMAAQLLHNVLLNNPQDAEARNCLVDYYKKVGATDVAAALQPN